MKRNALFNLWIWMLLLVSGLPFELAYGQGRASMALRRAAPVGTLEAITEFSASVGETISLDLFMDTRGDAATGVNVLIGFNDQFFEPVLVSSQGGGTVPFRSGQVNGIVTGNGFADGDGPGNPGGNGVGQYQLFYTEHTGLGANRPAFTGTRVIATFQVRILSKPESGSEVIRVDLNRGDGATGYFLQGQAGNRINFQQVTNATIDIVGFAIQPIPDMLLFPAGSDSVDLNQFLETNVTWVHSIPDSLQIQLDPGTQILSVTADSGFVGIRNIDLTGTTVFGGETSSTNLRVIVNSPPSIPDGSFPDTLHIAEDTPDTISLTGRAVDLDFQPVPLNWLASQGQNIDASISDDDDQLILTPGLNFNGTEQIQLTVIDQFDARDSVLVIVNVSPVNDPPVFSPFPELTIPIGQQDSSILLNAYILDVDHELFDPQYRFFITTEDNVLVSRNGLRVTVTPIAGSLGRMEIDVTALDPENDTASQTLFVTVTPPTGPAQPPVVTPPDPQKMGVISGGTQRSIQLNPLVEDPDTPDDQIEWDVSPIGEIQVNIGSGGGQTFAIFQAPETFVGFELLTFTATDPTNLSDAFQIIAFSVPPGAPGIGGLPDTAIVAGTMIDYLDFDDYIFDGSDTDEELEVKAIAPPSDLLIVIDPVTHLTTIEALGNAVVETKEVVFEVTNSTQQAETDTILVRVDAPGTVRLADFPDVSFLIGQTDQSLDLDDFVLSGPVDQLTWTPQFNTARLDVSIDSGTRIVSMQSVGGFTGQEVVTFTAQNPVGGSQAEGTVQVTVLPASSGNISLRSIPDVVFPSGTIDQSLRLNNYVEIGDTARLAWEASLPSGSSNLTVFIDPVTRFVTLSGAPGFVGVEAVTFTARDGSESAEETSLVTIAAKAEIGDLKLVVIANPVKPVFLDLFVLAKKELSADPTVIVDLDTERTLVPVKELSLERVEQLWSGNLTLQIGQVGSGQILASAVTTQQIALADTVDFTVGTLRPGFALTVRTVDVSLSIPPDAFREPSVVALVQSGNGEVEQEDPPGALKPVAGSLLPVTQAYSVVMSAAPIKASEIRFELGENRAKSGRIGIYRKEGAEWIYTAGVTTLDGKSMSISAPVIRSGVYRVMIDPDLGYLGTDLPFDQGQFATYRLSQNFPNPFNPSTSIRMSLPTAGRVRLVIYDLMGRSVKTLMDGSAKAGQYEITWDGRDQAGRRVASGIYIYRLEALGIALSKKMILLK